MAKNVLRAELNLEARRAKKAAKDATKEVAKFGKTSKKATGEATKGANKTADALGDVGNQLGLNVASFATWGAGGAAAVGVIVAGVTKLIGNLQELDRKLTETFNKFVTRAEQPKTRALADLRGRTPEQTVLDVQRRATRLRVGFEETRGTAFGIESILDDLAFAETTEITDVALRAGKLTGGGQDALVGVVTAFKTAGLAKTKEDFKLVLSKSAIAAQTSKFDLDEFAKVIAELLPQAIESGIDPDEFLAFAAAAASGFRSAERLSEFLKQVIIGTGKRGKTAIPADVLAGGTLAIAEFQAGVIGPALKISTFAAEQAAAGLGLDPALGGRIGAKLTPKILAKSKRAVELVRAADPARIEEQLAAQAKSNVGRVVAARAERELAETEEAVAAGGFEAQREEIQTEFGQALERQEPAAQAIRAVGLRGVAERVRQAEERRGGFIDRLNETLHDRIVRTFFELFGTRPSATGGSISVGTVNMPAPSVRAEAQSKSESARRSAE